MPHLILASASPRRSELLRSIGLEFDVRPADVPESVCAGESAEAFVRRLAVDKARAHTAPGEIVLGADTVVVLADEILGKPRDEADAAAMLRRLRERRHEVLTGIALVDGSDGRTVSEVVTTTVVFGSMADTEIDRYVRTGEPLDKAGAYAIQGRAGAFIERIEGSWANVVGLPVHTVKRMLDAWELDFDE